MTDAIELPVAPARAKFYPNPEKWIITSTACVGRMRAAGAGTRAPARKAPAALEQALSQARALIDTALSKHRDGEDALQDLAEDDAAVALEAKKLLHAAEYEIVCVAAPEDLAASLHPLAEALRAPAGSGPAAHVLLPFREGDRGRVRALIPDNAQHRVRLTGARLQKMLLVDRKTALVVSRVGPERLQAVMVHSPAIVKALHGLFSESWASAAPIRPVPVLDDPRQRETTRLVLAALRDGRKDDVAARDLGISVRTYRRYVADLMRDVGASSRFQAGVRACQLRLLPSDRFGA